MKKNTSKTRQPKTPRLPDPHDDYKLFERFAEAFVTANEYDHARIVPVVGLLRYLSELSNTQPHVIEDVVRYINQAIFGKIGDDAFATFEQKALVDLSNGVCPQN